MKLINQATQAVVSLSNDMNWSDEFDWTPVASKPDYTLTGGIVVQMSTKLAGRPISLSPAQEDMAWMQRADLLTLFEWAAVPGLQLLLQLEYPDDTRSFAVTFLPGSDTPVQAKPVKGFPGYSPLDWYVVSLKLMQI